MTCPGIKVPHPAGPQALLDLNVIKEKYAKQSLFLTEKKKNKKTENNEKFQKLHSLNSTVTKTLLLTILYNEQFSLFNKKGPKSWPADDMNPGLSKLLHKVFSRIM